MFMISKPCKVRHAVSKEKKPIPGLVSRLMRAVVLLDQVARVLDLPQFDRFWKDSNGFQIGNRSGVGGVFIDVDHTWSWRRTSTLMRLDIYVQ